ncbi:hypothetical protein TNCV_4255571 [Trichonephila clavipes]|nr:hypothetical protein TNCV_4255571 [Trichonephila clavipes]
MGESIGMRKASRLLTPWGEEAKVLWGNVVFILACVRTPSSTVVFHSLPAFSEYATLSTDYERDLISSTYMVCRHSWMTDTLAPCVHSYRIASHTSIGDHVVTCYCDICTRIILGTPVCCFSLFLNALRMRHSYYDDVSSVLLRGISNKYFR